MEFKNAQDAFEFLYKELDAKPVINGMKSAKNVLFTMLNPTQNKIESTFRKWSESYAEQEWQWYLSKNPNATEIAKTAKIWAKCMDEDGNVNSNYGSHIFNYGQWEYVQNLLKDDPFTRRASLSIYDAKNRHNFENDTPCTYAINFSVREISTEYVLDMTVMMRSNDLWFGFCNDQYQFSKIQSKMAQELGYSIGTYTHFVNDLHIYPKHFNKQQ
jgi:thymidylate synthase